jgi:hypothetical protein
VECIPVELAAFTGSQVSWLADSYLESTNYASLSFGFTSFAVLSLRPGVMNPPQKKTSLVLGLLGSICSLEVLHLLLQLRIHLVRDCYNVGKQRGEFQVLHVLVQCRKNADLQ